MAKTKYIIFTQRRNCRNTKQTFFANFAKKLKGLPFYYQGLADPKILLHSKTLRKLLKEFSKSFTKIGKMKIPNITK